MNMALARALFLLFLTGILFFIVYRCDKSSSEASGLIGLIAGACGLFAGAGFVNTMLMEVLR